ncbi:hypothetical protein FJTKL_10186 [Diaporthe vaccinii]|uniref:Uncharacterized protein n=1 Tax=Diaporthe vaccinii TaxID=105482 RepID=A0ABR4EKY8_9PEZI
MRLQNVLILEVGVDRGLSRLGEAGLGTIVGIAEVMAVACRLEVEAQRVVRRVTAAVGSPVQSRGVLRVAVGDELGQRDRKEITVRDGLDVLTGGERNRSEGKGGRHQPSQACDA